MYVGVNVHAKNYVVIVVYGRVIYRLLEAKSLLGLREDNHNHHALTILMEVKYGMFPYDGWMCVCIVYMYPPSAAV